MLLRSKEKFEYVLSKSRKSPSTNRVRSPYCNVKDRVWYTAYCTNLLTEYEQILKMCDRRAVEL